VDSLLVISLRDEIMTRFEVGIPIDDLLDDQTVAGLAALISARHPGTDQVPDQTAGDQSPIGSGSTLTRLKGDPGGNVVFFVTADALTPMAMMPLAKAMQLDRPVYSLHTPGLETDESPPENIEALADRYLADMRLIQPAGPYTLVGRCAGGVAAFEIALRLQEIDEQIRNLILLESLPPPVPESMDGEQAATAQWYRERQHQIHDEIAHRLAVLPTRVSRRFRAVQQTIDKAVAAYVPKEVFYGDLVLCRSNMYSHPFQQAWQTLIVGGLRTLDVPGNHVTMFDKPIVASLGAILGRVLGH